MKAFLTIVALIILGVLHLRWRMRPRRPPEPGFPFVHVNLDGSARELSPGEQEYVSREHDMGDGGRPYFKTSYESRDGWGSRSGYLSRRRLPKHVPILGVHPEYDARVASNPVDFIEQERASGRIIEQHADGSVTSAPDPDLSRRAAWKKAKQVHIEWVQELERMAREDESTQ